MPSDDNSGDFVLTGHLRLPEPFKVLSIAPLALGDAWVADAKIILRGVIPPLSSMNQDKVFAFVTVGHTKYEYDNTCPVILPPWAQLVRLEHDEALCAHLGYDAVLDLGYPDLVK